MFAEESLPTDSLLGGRENPNEAKRRLHAVDSLRMGAEFLIVFFHVSMGDPHSAGVTSFAYDLLSLFFVISGFVCTLSSTKPSGDWSWALKRIKAVLPLYLFFCGCNLVGYLCSKGAMTQAQTICAVLDFLACSEWINCAAYFIDVVLAGWYVQDLFWCWLLYAYWGGSLQGMWEKHTWPKMAIAWGGLTLAAHWLPAWRYYVPFRAVEFLIGTGVGYAQRPYPLVTLWALGGLVSVYLAVHWGVLEESLAFTQGTLTWALLLASVKDWEWPSHPVLRALNPLSLYLYLSHMTVLQATRSIMAVLHIGDMYQHTLMVLWCYLCANLVGNAHRWVIDRLNPVDTGSI